MHELNQEALAAQLEHRTIREFKPDPIPGEIFDQIIEVARRTATSTAKACAWPPRERMCSATASASTITRSTMPTVAPQSASVSAMERPRPRAAPVMNTLRPERSG